MSTVKIARKTGRPTHAIVSNRDWLIEEAQCGASTHRYTVAEGTVAQVTCKRCIAKRS